MEGLSEVAILSLRTWLEVLVPKHQVYSGHPSPSGSPLAAILAYLLRAGISKKTTRKDDCVTDGYVHWKDSRWYRK